ncbi:MAG: hypothetical protein QM500_04465, partial [Methylococcales bacterium]
TKEAKDIIERIRVAHFSLIITCIAIFIALSLEPKAIFDHALSDAKNTFIAVQEIGIVEDYVDNVIEDTITQSKSKNDIFKLHSLFSDSNTLAKITMGEFEFVPLIESELSSDPASRKHWQNVIGIFPETYFSLNDAHPGSNLPLDVISNLSDFIHV